MSLTAYEMRTSPLPRTRRRPRTTSTPRQASPGKAFDRALESKIASGALIAIDNQIDTTTGTVKLRAKFDNRTTPSFPISS